MHEGSAQTREALLDAAELLFGRKGYSGVGIRDIADLAHANIASIKYHFGSKLELYLATVRRAMSRGDAEMVWGTLRDQTNDRAAAACMLARFIHVFLVRHLASTDASACVNLMLHEAAEPSEAIDAVVRDYIQPRMALVVSVIRAIAPGADEFRHIHMAESILGQLMHYRVFRALMERMQGVELNEPAQIRAIGNHITEFSLRAMGCPPAMITQALGAASTLDQPAALHGSAR